MNLNNIQESALRVVELLDDYSGNRAGRREMRLDPVLYGYLEGRFGYLTRQHYVGVTGSSKPKRIDFRRGTTNPVVIEFAVRRPISPATFYGSQNGPELRKLCRVTQAEARLRVLLLIDFCAMPLAKGRLQKTYKTQTAGRGNFQRYSVRVLYVHRKVQYSFLWKP